MNRNFANKDLASTFENKLMNISSFFSKKKKKERERELIKQAYFFGHIIIVEF